MTLGRPQRPCWPQRALQRRCSAPAARGDGTVRRREVRREAARPPPPSVHPDLMFPSSPEQTLHRLGPVCSGISRICGRKRLISLICRRSRQPVLRNGSRAHTHTHTRKGPASSARARGIRVFLHQRLRFDRFCQGGDRRQLLVLLPARPCTSAGVGVSRWRQSDPGASASSSLTPLLLDS